MKVGSAVLGLHVAVLCVFSLTQGCVTSESQGSGRPAGARHKGPWKYEHKVASSGAVSQGQVGGYEQGIDESYEVMVFEDAGIDSSDMGSTVEPYVPPASSESFTEVYIVQKGDVLSQLAVDFDTTVPRLVSMNGLSNPDVLYVGQELRVPAGRSSSPATTKKSTSSVKKGGSYEIQKGDTLSGIAVAAGVAISDLRSLNNIKADKIFAGETIYIPSYGKVPSSTQKSVAKKTLSEPAAVEPAPSAPAPAPMAFGSTVAEPAAPMIVETTAPTVEMVADKVLYPGETLDDVARQYSVSKAEIMRLNNITDESAVREGQRLRVPISE
ncbi:LysM peptidoglycan-binding domain-containing protein [Pontiella sulfatireligans]|uniref:Autolysin n=1 Tax=Pontiella sulfatireligans TaxID=2750658 RepID=A0A6C2UMA9_9BACT|nr:LysM peptidoglycan-binding domain-containing protein [Pontiella sulfatireligans]VGO21053.1 Autolysin [Pontiella sulfatireligans]